MQICDDNGATAHLLNDGVGVIGTDTVYCLVARVASVAAVERLYRLKGRRAKPGPILAGSIDQLLNLGVDPLHVTKAASYWGVEPADRRGVVVRAPIRVFAFYAQMVIVRANHNVARVVSRNDRQDVCTAATGEPPQSRADGHDRLLEKIEPRGAQRFAKPS